MHNSSFGLGVRPSSSSMHQSFNTSLNTSSIMDFGGSRRARGGGEVIMSTAMTQSVEPYGLQLPAMVRGALSSFSTSTHDAHQMNSCRLDRNGWAWLVASRKLYVWRHSGATEGGNNKRVAIACRELALPPSELVHNAQLIAVLPSGGNTSPACIAVSPEGHITFWPNISNESTTVTINADIPGQECDSLTSVWPIGCILTTTSATVLLIKCASGRGNKPSLSCVALGVQKGWLGGWSKKMSNMLFTPMPAACSGLDGKRAKIVVPLSMEDDPVNPGNNREGKFYIFQGSILQTWEINSEAQSHVFVQEVNIDEQLRRQFWENVWGSGGGESGNSSGGDIRGIQSWILDATFLPQDKHLAVLAAAKSQYESTDNLVYGIVTFEVKNYRKKETWKFIPITCNISSGSCEDEQLYSWKLLSTQSYFYVVSNDTVHTATDKRDSPTDFVDSSQLGGPIVGAGNISLNSIVILVPKHGLLTFRAISNQEGLGLGLDDTFSDIRVPDHLALSMTQGPLDTTPADDNVVRYKSAFIQYLQKKPEESTQLLTELFPLVPSRAPHDPLDTATINIARKLIDEAPTADPRWATNFNRNESDPVGIKSKILIKNFLLDKREGLELFFGFINNTGILQRLKGILVNEDAIATGSLLYNCYEKVYFALCLQTIQTEPQFRKIVDTAIKSIVEKRKETLIQARSANLTPNDIFYKEVSKVNQIIPVLVALGEEELERYSSKEIPTRVALTNQVILRSLLEIQNGGDTKLLQVKDSILQSIMVPGNHYQVLNWIAKDNILKAMKHQQEITVSRGIQNSDVELGLKLDLIKQLQQFTDLLLDALKINVESIQDSERYSQKLDRFESFRSSQLRRHLDIGDYDGASLLAEKYLDFDILAIICYRSKNWSRMESFLLKYQHLGFLEFLFQWYVNQHKSAELVDTFSKTRFRNELSSFLEQYPKIAWHHTTLTDDFNGSGQILCQLANQEEHSADDKKFYLAMAKLAALAATDPQKRVIPQENPFVQEIDKDFEVLEFQNRLSDEILDSFGVTRNAMRVFSPSEMIDMYTTSEVEFHPDNFTSAVGLAQFMINEELQVEKRLLIVHRAIIRDPWDQWSTDHPADVIVESCLYNFLISAIQKGWNLDQVYPLGGLFTFPEMRKLLENPNVKFLLRACHEHISTTITSLMTQE